MIRLIERKKYVRDSFQITDEHIFFSLRQIRACHVLIQRQIDEP